MDIPNFGKSPNGVGQGSAGDQSRRCSVEIRSELKNRREEGYEKVDSPSDYDPIS
jgi:hypothetical protein